MVETQCAFIDAAKVAGVEHARSIAAEGAMYVPMGDAVLAPNVPADFADLLAELYAERRTQTRARLALGAHERFGVVPTTFAEFAGREADAIR